MEDSVQSTFNEGSAEITVSNSTVIGTNTGTLQPSLVDELKNITNVSDTAGQLSVTEANYSSMQSRGSSMMMTVYGIEPSKLKLIGIDEVNGSVYEENSSQAIVGIFYSERNNISIGDNITVRGEEFEVVGIFETGAMFRDNGIYMSLGKLQNLTGNEELSSILVKTTEGSNDTIISDEIESRYENLSTLTSEEMASMLDNVIGILDAASLAISGLAILVGGIGVINTMVMTVYERTKEIGVLKSIGWKSKKILLMILGETLVLTTLSGIVGSIFGILIAEVGVRLIGTEGFSLVYTPKTFILAFGITIIVGMIGGVYPAYKASKLAPTEALRYE